MKMVYLLEFDLDRVARIQKATVETKEFGIQQTDGLLGSDAWWQKIESGCLKKHTLKGTIGEVYQGMSDWPMFELIDSTGEKHFLTRHALNSGLDKEYVEGRRIELEFVEQKHKNEGNTRIILEVRIGSEQDADDQAAAAVDSES